MWTRASVKEALGSGSRLGPACELMEISTRIYQRWSRPDNVCDRRPGARREPRNKLGEDERQKLLEVANTEYEDLPPSKIVRLCLPIPGSTWPVSPRFTRC